MAKVLIIDDSPTHVAGTQQALESAGYEVVIAMDGVEGIRMAQETKPDLVLMDIVMPELNGFQATRKLAHDPSTKDIPIVIITTKDQETDRVWGERQGAKDYLVKPVSDKQLLETVKKYI
ncbi:MULTISPECIES: response regulator [Gynuella]|uniref:Response regulator consisting of a CheY-like receiver domain and a winged-helix DNA-binding domain n=1 Tax=Gynuella sunshinyii YC6258 TaxID=1445510 RepID=A0A0C5VP41_9GAMM|nr:response regulator [Gynuella sunshinyii]AJQ96427.1 response regulator consisting of a CheY-like receiver domain and a winged-helix DNA-binding domain [Gynuella sunshinyii YC6258]